MRAAVETDVVNADDTSRALSLDHFITVPPFFPAIWSTPDHGIRFTLPSHRALPIIARQWESLRQVIQLS